jgi:hypothetical protein
VRYKKMERTVQDTICSLLNDGHKVLVTGVCGVGKAHQVQEMLKAHYSGNHAYLRATPDQTAEGLLEQVDSNVAAGNVVVVDEMTRAPRQFQLDMMEKYQGDAKAKIVGLANPGPYGFGLDASVKRRFDFEVAIEPSGEYTVNKIQKFCPPRQIQ